MYRPAVEGTQALGAEMLVPRAARTGGALSVDQSSDRERNQRSRSNQRQQVIRGTDALELRASVAHFDVTDRANGYTVTQGNKGPQADDVTLA